MSKQSKLTSLSELVEQIPDGSSIGLGGSLFHRRPFAFCRELIRKKKSNLEIIKAGAGYDIYILCRAVVIGLVRAGIVAMEGNFGLAPY